MKPNYNFKIQISIFTLSLLVSCSSCLSKEVDEGPFMGTAEFDKNIPSPQSVIGFPVGERAVTHQQLVNYLKILAEKSDRVKLNEYATTYEGRCVYCLTITSKENHKKLSQIKETIAKLSDPRKLKSDGEAQKIISDSPAAAVLVYGIHGDELSSSDAALYVIYHLAASKDKQTQKLLDDLVIIINPMINPDGRERFLSQIFQMTGNVENPDIQSMQHTALWARGRGNHYLFDMNRDWLMQTFPEIKATAKLVLDWNPQLLVDSHEQSALETYLFDPPNDPVNAELSPSINKWRKFFGDEQAKAFNKFGWSYYTKDWYSDWGPIYTNAWANLLGSIGILYEQARADSADVKLPTGKIMTYRQTVHHHIVSTFANLQTLADNKKQIMTDFYNDRKQDVSMQKGDKVLIVAPAKDTADWENFLELVRNQGIEIEFAQSDFEASKAIDIWGNTTESKKFPAGTCIIKPAQPHRRLLTNLLYFDVKVSDEFLKKERRELENHKETLLYDSSAWSLPICFGMDAYWADSIADVKTNLKLPAKIEAALNKGGFGYIIEFTSSDVYPLLIKLFEQNCQVRIAAEKFKMNGKEFDRGTMLLRGNENPDNLFEILQQLQPKFDAKIIGVDTALVEDGPDLGTIKFRLLSAPKTALASQWPISSGSFGSIWFLIDRNLNLKCTPFNIQNINGIDLRIYNCLILPNCSSLDRLLDNKAVEKIRNWVQDGGTLIAVGGSAAFCADANNRLSAVRIRESVLGRLDEYAEAVKREQDAQNIKVDPNIVWGKTSSKVVNEPEKKNAAEADIEKLRRDEIWQQLFSPHGAFLNASVNNEQWLSYGLDKKMAVLFDGSDVFLSRYPVQTPVRFSDAKNLRISGLLWPEAKTRIADSAYATVESIGRGQIIIFANDPTYRMWVPEQERLLKNAILLGPGLGASQPNPW